MSDDYVMGYVDALVQVSADEGKPRTVMCADLERTRSEVCALIRKSYDGGAVEYADEAGLTVVRQTSGAFRKWTLWLRDESSEAPHD